MSKRNIRGKSGKQLYLNQLFIGGMHHSSSEMKEGQARTIANFNITPMGDSAVPRKPFISIPNSYSIGKYIYPFHFAQAPLLQYYFEFHEDSLISEQDFASDSGIPISAPENDPLRVFSRETNALNTSVTSSQPIGESSEVASVDETDIYNEIKPIIDGCILSEGMTFDDYIDTIYSQPVLSFTTSASGHYPSSITTTVTGSYDRYSATDGYYTPLGSMTTTAGSVSTRVYSSMMGEWDYGVSLGYKIYKGAVLAMSGTTSGFTLTSTQCGYLNGTDQVRVACTTSGNNVITNEVSLTMTYIPLNTSYDVTYYTTVQKADSFTIMFHSSSNPGSCYVKIRNAASNLAVFSGSAGDISSSHAVDLPKGTILEIGVKPDLSWGTTSAHINFTYSKPVPVVISSNHDGDTCTDSDGTVYRLWGYDSPEIWTPWALYAKVALDYLLNYPDAELLVDTSYGVDVTESERLVGSFYIKLGTEYISVSSVMVRLGLGRASYIYQENSTLINKLLENEAIAKQQNSYIWSSNLDPSYTHLGNIVTYPQNTIIQFVKISYNKQVSNFLNNKYDSVSYQYLDYCDSVAIVGRVIQSDEIIYKGILFITPVVPEGNYDLLSFRIDLPPNDYEGVQPDIVKAQENGYNLLNTNLIHLENTNGGFFGILGLAVSTQDDSSIVEEGVLGQDVKLHAILATGYNPIVMDPSYYLKLYITINYMNPTGYLHDPYLGILSVYKYKTEKTEQKVITYNTAPGSVNNFGFDLTKGTPAIAVEMILTKIEAVVITDATEITYDISSSIISDKITIMEPIIKFEKDGEVLYNSSIEEEQTIHDGIIYNTNGIIDKPDYYSDLFYSIGGGPDVKKFVTSFGDLVLSFDQDRQTLSNYIPVSSDPAIVYTLDNNYPVPLLVMGNGKVWTKQYVTVNSTIVPIQGILSFTEKIYGAWYEAPLGSEKWKLISKSNIFEQAVNGNITVTSGQSEDISYTIRSSNDLTLKFAVEFAKTPYFGGSVLSETEIISDLNTIYKVMPRFKIGVMPKTISNTSLTNLINFRNATRIGVFNRQIILYGPYTISNFLQFSRFEQQWYYPFPFYNISFDEPIVYVYPFKDDLVVFGKHNIYMLTGGTTPIDLSLFKIYENLSINETDIGLVTTLGTSLVFFNSNTGYLIVPNVYSDDPSNIKIYKLTDNIGNALQFPEYMLRPFYTDRVLTAVTADYISYTDESFLCVVANYKVNDTPIPVIYRYNLTYKNWSIYTTKSFDRIEQVYSCEPNLGKQFIVSKNDYSYLALLQYASSERNDITHTGERQPVFTYLDSGYLSVDTMNDKRFKDLIFEFDNIEGETSLTIELNFYIDGTPVLVTDIDMIPAQIYTGSYHDGVIELEDVKEPLELKLVTNRIDNEQVYGAVFKITNTSYLTVGRCHLRIPLFGKGRLPSFQIKISGTKNYEFINYSLIYKEKNINRRR